MKQYTFKDGTKIIASSVEEAKSKHKVTADTHSQEVSKAIAKIKKLIGSKALRIDEDDRDTICILDYKKLMKIDFPYKGNKEDYSKVEIRYGKRVPGGRFGGTGAFKEKIVLDLNKPKSAEILKGIYDKAVKELREYTKEKLLKLKKDLTLL